MRKQKRSVRRSDLWEVTLLVFLRPSRLMLAWITALAGVRILWALSDHRNCDAWMDDRRFRRRRKCTAVSWITWTSGRAECWKPHQMDRDLCSRRSSETSSDEYAPETGSGSRTSSRTGATSLHTYRFVPLLSAVVDFTPLAGWHLFPDTMYVMHLHFTTSESRSYGANNNNNNSEFM